MFYATFNTFINLLPGFILGLAGSACGVWIAHRLSESRRRKEEFNKAAAAFRNAFLPEITYLKYNVGTDQAGSTDSSLAQFLKAGLVNRHIEALGVFRIYLPVCQRSGIDKAWQEYQNNITRYESKPMTIGEKEAGLKEIEAFLDQFAAIK